MKTKITLLNKDVHILEGDPQKVMNELQNGNGGLTVETTTGPKTIDPYDIVMFENVSE
ncbi:hypothetical protein [Sporosarcina sp. 6E9]|uniref:hypothetical protein n=1 Tax=Sporosarcina sp. 6E9 TaxID=2819235 RepID=UPI001AD2C5AA|nr:hypothetical protein [Sporosarcina sp. 6E9]MBO1909710.1 hypothetical protein [Microvirga sp. 3-52]